MRGNRETRTSICLVGSVAAEEPRKLEEMIIWIPEGPGTGVGKDASAGDDSVFTESIKAAFYIST
ncbi:hypothetical protein H5410_031985 [Solanum commersonii]|uniref:Uncharacterized protein n=1 Tax=Solanum commersonii TaxID=4109 RepID=A0A9J5YLK3_SOLCO|nr:hypothetical protein H5410_031985 [Solanum commersonii]